MAAPAFTKFDARAFLNNASQGSTPAKVAKVAKVPRYSGSRLQTFAGFAAFAEGQAESENCEPTPDAWTDAHEERAAIIQYDGAAPRVWAEALARLDPNKPPADVSLERWLRFINDCGCFLDAGWAARAAALGWGPLDLFGCDRDRPFAPDQMGLLWLHNGGSILELHRDRALVRTKDGALQTYRRRPVEVGRVVLAWELAS
jgi:hypothetical protein